MSTMLDIWHSNVDRAHNTIIFTRMLIGLLVMEIRLSTGLGIGHSNVDQTRH